MQKILLFLSLLTLFACEQEIEFPTDYKGDVLVLNAKVLSNHIDVNLSHTADISSAAYFDSLWVLDGDIRLYRGGDQLGVFTNLGDGQYELNDIEMEENVDYYLKATAPGFPDVQSNTFSLLPTPDTPTIEAKQIENIYGNADIDLVQVTVDFKDKEVGDNYYLFRVTGMSNGVIHSSLSMWYSGDLADVCGIYNGTYGSSGVVFALDQCFELAPFTVGLNVEIEGSFYDPQIGNQTFVCDKLIVEYGLIDRSFFEFINAQEQPEGIEAGLVEPYYNFSAIQGGYGQVFTSNIKSSMVTW